MKISHNDMLFYSDVWSAKANEVAMTSYSLVMSGVLKLMIFFFTYLISLKNTCNMK